MKKYILLLCAVLSIAITSYFSLLPLNGVSQADISDKFPTSITPAGFTFSIWSIIYLSWLVLGMFILNGKLKVRGQDIYVFSSAVLISTIWLIPWHFGYIFTSLLVIIILLGFLVKLFSLKHENIVFRNSMELFLGWIIVASIANFHVFLVAYNLYSCGILITFLSIIAGTAINYILQKKYYSFIPSIVFIWALIGIIAKQQNDYTQVISFLCIIFLLLSGFFTKVRRKRI